MQRRRLLLAVVVFGMVAAGVSVTAYGAGVWDAGGGANDNWDYSSGGGIYDNWDDNLLPGSTADVTIQNVAAAGNSISLNGDRTVNSLTLNQTANQAFTIDNNTLTVTSGRITRNSGSQGNHDINADVLLGANGTIVNNSSTSRLALTVVKDGGANCSVSYRGTGTINIFGAATYGGASLVAGPTFSPMGSGSVLNSPSWTVVGSTISLGTSSGVLPDNGTTTFGRLKNDASVTLHAGSLILNAANNQTGDNATERFGTLTFGAGRNTLRSIRNGTGEATLLPGAFARDGGATGTRGTVLIDQNSTSRDLGAKVFIKGTSYAGLITVGGGGSRATDASIVPYVLVNNIFDTSRRVNSFIRVDATTGLVPLASADYVTDINAVNSDGNDNVRVLTAATTVTMNNSTNVNALIIDNSTGSGTSELAGNPGTTLTVKSGAILGAATGGNNAGTKLSVPTLAFGSAEGFIANGGGGGSGFTVASAITGNNGLTITSVGSILTLSGDNSGVNGPVTINSGTAVFSSKLAADTDNVIRVRAGASFRVDTDNSGGSGLTVGSVAGAGEILFSSNGKSLSIAGTRVTSGAQPSVNLLAGGSISPGDVPQLLGATLSTGTLTMRNSNVATPAGNLVVNLSNGALYIDLASLTYYDALTLTTDQKTNNATLTLGDGGSNPGATLVVSMGFAPSVGDLFKIVDVAGTNAISGQFSNGASVTSQYSGKNYTFTILYNSSLAGGDGNDIVLRLDSIGSGARGTVLRIQ